MASDSTEKSAFLQKHIAIFASGTGSNARKIIQHFQGHPSISVSLVLSNKPNAGVLEIAREAGIKTCVINRHSFYETEETIDLLRSHSIDLIALAGFLWLVPEPLVEAFPGKILNIHPALLPNYGGKGMYGMNVHRAVFEAGEKRSGITIHAIDAVYDKGHIIFQESCDISDASDPTEVARRVLELEHLHFAPVIERLLNEERAVT